jgi:uncharacterized protein (TIGR03790 family)
MRVVLLLFAAITIRAGIDPATVVVVFAEGDPESKRLAVEYAKLRNIPANNCVGLTIPSSEPQSLSWTEYSKNILNPLRAALLERKLLVGKLAPGTDDLGRQSLTLTEDPRVRWVVLCRGLPWRIHRNSGTDGKMFGPSPISEAASVDSELCLLATEDNAPNGPAQNPWYGLNGNAEPKDGARFIRTARLDGPSLASVERSLGRMYQAEKLGLRGRAYIDQGGPYAEGDTWFSRSAGICRTLGFPTDVETSKEVISTDVRFDAPAFYFGWYTQKPKGRLAERGTLLAPGAIALHLHSFSGQALHDPINGWTAALVEAGAALTFGNVDEPYLTLTVRPDVLMLELAKGQCAGEAAWRATPVMSWMGVIIGDPFYQPFARDIPQQLTDLSQKPDNLSIYASLRAAELMRHKPEERKKMLVASFYQSPRIALLLEIARDAIAAGQDIPWDNQVLDYLPHEDFGLVLESARLLKSKGKTAQAKELYDHLLGRLVANPARAEGLKAEVPQ